LAGGSSGGFVVADLKAASADSREPIGGRFLAGGLDIDPSTAMPPGRVVVQFFSVEGGVNGVCPMTVASAILCSPSAISRACAAVKLTRTDNFRAGAPSSVAAKVSCRTALAFGNGPTPH
jgi:hypothetical protein